jgi:hypothetical protein
MTRTLVTAQVALIALTLLGSYVLQSATLPHASPAGSVLVTGPTPFKSYGPLIDIVTVNVFSDALSQLARFEAGEIDLSDATVPLTKIADYASNPDFILAQDLVSGRYFVGLNGWDGIVNEKGVGLPGFWSVINMEQLFDYVPSNSLYRPGGGDPELLRMGLGVGTTSLNVFYATSPSELMILRLVYDSLLKVNPDDPSSTIDWMTKQHRTIPNSPEVGQTRIFYSLRPDLKWQDGTPVTAHDVVFTITNYRDIPSASFFLPVSNVISAKALASNQVEVIVAGTGTTAARDIGSVPIIPQHLWDLDRDGRADPLKVTLGFDPVAAGILAGSGPFICQDQVTGAIGGGCTFDSNGSVIGQTVLPGGRLLLARYEDYMRDPPTVSKMFVNPGGIDPAAPATHSAISSLHAQCWADINDDGTVDILDVASVAAAFGQPDPYWDDRVYGVVTGVVDIGEVSLVAFYFGTSGCRQDPYYVRGTGVFVKTVVVTATGPGFVTASFDLYNSAGSWGTATVKACPFPPATPCAGQPIQWSVPTSAPTTLAAGTNAIIPVSGVTNPTDPGPAFCSFEQYVRFGTILSSGPIQDVLKTRCHM